MDPKRILFLLVWILCASVYAQQAHEGVIDLRKAPLATEEVALDGEWEFYWSQLLDPKEIESAGELVKFPSAWSSIPGKNLTNKGYATYRVQVLLPTDGQYYSLHVEDMFSSFRLFFNGKEIYSNGKVGTSKEDYIPQWKPDFINLHHTRDTNELVLQIANFDHRKGGASQSLKIGEAKFMKQRQLSIWTYDLLLTGSLLIGGLFLLGLYLFGHHDKAIFFFAMFCLTYSYRVLGAGFYELHHLVDWSWHVLSRFEYISLFISVFLFSNFVQSLYPDVVNKYVFRFLNLICLTFTGITLVLPPAVFTYLMVPFLLVIALYIAVAFYVYFIAYKWKLVGSQYALASTGVVMLIFAYNIVVYFGIMDRMEPIDFWGKEAFLLSQSMILSFRFAYTLKSEKLKAEIASMAKSDFLSTISHEIRTPLNAVVGLSHLLLTESPRKDQKESLTSLKYSAEHLTALINDILDYNKLESGSVEFEEMDVNLHEIGDRLLKVHSAKAEEKGLYLKGEWDERLNLSLLLDATRFAQIMNNLIDNAIKFTKEGGVSIRMILVSEDGDGQEIRFEIEDTGIGIPDDKKAMIFERFTQASSSTTREFGGSGLGLSIIKKLLELQGSSIQLESTYGKGSKFYFTQKFAYGNMKSTWEKEEVAEDTQLEGKRILLVEDNRINIVVASKFLSNWGVKYELAQNGVEAVKMASQNEYDLILMDLQMPEMDGYEAAEHIRKEDQKTPIIALTASALFRIQQGIAKSGMNDFVTKPFDPKELKRKIAKYVL